jgi:hypothetical protein
MKSSDEVDYKRVNTTFPILMHQHKLANGDLSIIQAKSEVFPKWVFEVEQRIEALEKELCKRKTK